MSKPNEGDRVHLGGDAVFDQDLLGGSTKKGAAAGNYVTSIETGGDLDEDEDDMDTSAMPKLGIRQVKNKLFIYMI
jgi:hypothetical protein